VDVRRRLLLPVFALLGALALLVVTSRSIIEECRFAFDPKGPSPLAGLCIVKTSRPVTVDKIFIEGGVSHAWSGRQVASQRLEIPILGLRPGRTHRVRVQLRTERGETIVTPSVEFRTEPLPEDFPEIVAGEHEPGGQGGYILCSIANWQEEQEKPDGGYLTVLDTFGQVVWYQRVDEVLSQVKMLPSGNLLTLESAGGQLIEQDLLARTERVYQASGRGRLRAGAVMVEVDTIFSDFVYDPEGSLFWTLASRQNGPIQETSIVAFDKRGTIRQETSLTAPLSPQATLPWVQSLDLDGAQRRALVCIPQSDTVAEVDLQSDYLLWLFAPLQSWPETLQFWGLRPLEGTERPKGVKSARWARNGGLLCFESNSTHSRVAEFLVDLKNRTVSQTSEFTGLTSFHSSQVGEVDELSKNGHLQVTECGRLKDQSYHARIVELRMGAEPKTYLDLTFRGSEHLGCFLPRSERLTSLYGSKARSL
jgi:Arylsulfotransferase (ASST)